MTIYELVEIYRRTFWELFQEELEAEWQVLLNGTGTGEPIGILSLEEKNMLFTKRAKELMAEEQRAFVTTYEDMVESMVTVMQERGEGRDSETPIHFRRSPEANLEMIRSKCMRIESLLSSLNTNEPDEATLKKIRNESVDVANYSLFTATNMELLLEDGETTEEILSSDGVVDRWDKRGIPKEVRESLINGHWEHTGKNENLWLEEGQTVKDWKAWVAQQSAYVIKYDEVTEIRNGNLYCRTTSRFCPRATAWGEAQYCFGAGSLCNKSWLPKETEE